MRRSMKASAGTVYHELTCRDSESCCIVRETSSDAGLPPMGRLADAARRATLYASGSCSDNRVNVRRCSSTFRLYLSSAVQEASASEVKAIDQKGPQDGDTMRTCLGILFPPFQDLSYKTGSITSRIDIGEDQTDIWRERDWSRTSRPF